MPSKSVAGWTQVPVVAADLMEIRYTRLDSSTNQILVTYEVKDSLGAVRQIATLSQQVGTYPVSAAAILSSINTAQGT